MGTATKARPRTETGGGGRAIRTNCCSSLALPLSVGSVETFDAFMAENAAEVTLQNLQRLEPSPTDPSIKLCYLGPTDIGPYRTQMRLTVRVELPQSGCCNVKILNMENGMVDKKTGEATFAKLPDETPFMFETENTITWINTGSAGVRVEMLSEASTETTVPWWFPLPDKLVEALTTAFVSQILSKGHKKVLEQIDVQFRLWLAARLP